jgi:hypothetical protein
MDLWFLKLMRNQGSQALRIVAFCIETFPYPNLAKCTISKVDISMTSNQKFHIIFITISKSPLPHTHSMILIISKKKVMILSYWNNWEIIPFLWRCGKMKTMQSIDTNHEKLIISFIYWHKKWNQIFEMDFEDHQKQSSKKLQTLMSNP